jgi:hypothetical protein
MLAELVSRQHGVVAVWQLEDFTEAMLRWRVENGRLFRVQPFVYSLTPSVSARGRLMAAVLTYGPDAVLSHRAAAAVWDLGPWPSGSVDVTVPARRKPRPGIRLHRATVERVVREGFPVTTITRTLIDQAADLPLGRLRDRFEKAERLGILDVHSINEQMAGKRGAKKIRAVLAEWSEPEPTRSELERALTDLCRHHGLPLPSQNVSLLGYEVDAFWPETGLVVELDGCEFHRFTWRQVIHEPAAVAAAIRSGCPRGAGRARAPAPAGARPPSAP